MLDDILTALKAMGEAEEVTVTVTTVTVKPRTLQKTTDDGRLNEDPIGASDGLSHSHRAVLAAVRDGNTRPTEIEEVVGLKHRRVAELLRELVESGHLVQPRYGRYETAA